MVTKSDCLNAFFEGRFWIVFYPFLSAQERPKSGQERAKSVLGAAKSGPRVASERPRAIGAVWSGQERSGAARIDPERPGAARSGQQWLGAVRSGHRGVKNQNLKCASHKVSLATLQKRSPDPTPVVTLFGMLGAPSQTVQSNSGT